MKKKFAIKVNETRQNIFDLFTLMVYKNENFFGSDLEFCTISLLVMLKY